jgi:hypothetical protein
LSCLILYDLALHFVASTSSRGAPPAPVTVKRPPSSFASRSPTLMLAPVEPAPCDFIIAT